MIPRALSPSESAETTSPKPPDLPDMYLARLPISSGSLPVSERVGPAALGRQHLSGTVQDATGIAAGQHAGAFAQHLGMREDDQRRLTRAALLHDVGKAFVPVAILDKPGKLTEAEMSVVRKHPRLGYDALAAQGIAWIQIGQRGAGVPVLERGLVLTDNPARAQFLISTFLEPSVP